MEPVPALDEFLSRVVAWCRRRSDIEAVALVGSHARGEAGPHSDIDLLILTNDPEALLREPAWTGEFGQVERLRPEDWGDVQSIRAWYREGFEVEFGISTPAWASGPLDSGKREVSEGGVAVLLDRTGSLTGSAGRLAGNEREA